MSEVRVLTSASDRDEYALNQMVSSYSRATKDMEELKLRMSALSREQSINARAAYRSMAASGRVIYVAKLVDIERAINQRGAQARVAKCLDLSPGRVNQLLALSQSI